jgi:hypothetical protein
MQIEIFTLCRDAKYDIKSLTIVGPGGTNTFSGKRLPAGLSFSIIAKIRFEHGDEGEHSIKIELMDADLIPVKVAGRTVSSVAKTDARIVENSLSYIHVEDYRGLIFEKAGDFCFELRIDGEIKGRIPVFLRLKN